MERADAAAHVEDIAALCAGPCSSPAPRFG
jgi:hypothetical protein